MSNLTMWSLIVGFLMPNVVAILQQPKWSSALRSALTLVAAILGGFGTAYFTGMFNFEDIVGSVLITGVAAITFYKGFWKPTGVATAIENATSKTPPTAKAAHPDDAPHDPDTGVLKVDGKHEYPNERGEVDTRTIAILALVVAVVVVLILVLPAINFR